MSRFPSPPPVPVPPPTSVTDFSNPRWTLTWQQHRLDGSPSPASPSRAEVTYHYPMILPPQQPTAQLMELLRQRQWDAARCRLQHYPWDARYRCFQRGDDADGNHGDAADGDLLDPPVTSRMAVTIAATTPLHVACMVRAPAELTRAVWKADPAALWVPQPPPPPPPPAIGAHSGVFHLQQPQQQQGWTPLHIQLVYGTATAEATALTLDMIHHGGASLVQMGTTHLGWNSDNQNHVTSIGTTTTMAGVAAATPTSAALHVACRHAHPVLLQRQRGPSSSTPSSSTPSSSTPSSSTPSFSSSHFCLILRALLLYSAPPLPASSSSSSWSLSSSQPSPANLLWQVTLRHQPNLLRFLLLQPATNGDSLLWAEAQELWHRMALLIQHASMTMTTETDEEESTQQQSPSISLPSSTFAPGSISWTQLVQFQQSHAHQVDLIRLVLRLFPNMAMQPTSLVRRTATSSNNNINCRNRSRLTLVQSWPLHVAAAMPLSSHALGPDDFLRPRPVVSRPPSPSSPMQALQRLSRQEMPYASIVLWPFASSTSTASGTNNGSTHASVSSAAAAPFRVTPFPATNYAVLPFNDPIVPLIQAHPAAVLWRDDTGRLPLHWALDPVISDDDGDGRRCRHHRRSWETGIAALVSVHPTTVSYRCPRTQLYPFQLAALPDKQLTVVDCMEEDLRHVWQLETIWELVRLCPHVVKSSP